MKNIFLTIFTFFAICFTTTLQAQDIADNAIGLRLGDGDGFGAEISYQRALSANNRLEGNLGWRSGSNFNGFKLTGLYQWLWELDGDFNWYAGAGGGLSSVNADLPNNREVRDTFVFLAGNLGVEYNFEIPLLIALDFRPEFGFVDDDLTNDVLNFGIALSLRYQF
jgi:hypothetical protein